MTDLLKQMAEALRSIAVASSFQPSPLDACGVVAHVHGIAKEALALFDAKAAEQAAGGGDAVAWEVRSPFGLITAVRDLSPDARSEGESRGWEFRPLGYIQPAPAAPVQQVGELPSVEDVEAAVGMGAGAWDTIDPVKIIAAVIALSTRPEQSDAEIDALAEAEGVHFLVHVEHQRRKFASVEDAKLRRIVRAALAARGGA